MSSAEASAYVTIGLGEITEDQLGVPVIGPVEAEGNIFLYIERWIR
ncbi:hypothetical protein ACFOU0_02800 [Salinicoccus sesuvii]|uniref:Uncharacterized protein n=1 Tax=Salinicoccus sesuvii TaxID=868281 RepID=A0ABV7N1R6_9STAP